MEQIARNHQYNDEAQSNRLQIIKNGDQFILVHVESNLDPAMNFINTEKNLLQQAKEELYQGADEEKRFHLDANPHLLREKYVSLKQDLIKAYSKYMK